MKPRFVGRERELTQISGAIEQIKQRRGRMFFITGETGIGKTRFLEEISRISVEKELNVLSSACIGENAVPYLAIEDALRASSISAPPEPVPLGLTPISFGIPQISEHEYTSGKTRILETYLRKFEELSDKNPTVLLIDDLQWADTGTLNFLHYLSRCIAEMHLVCVCAYVDDRREDSELTKIVQNINIERNCTIIHLGPLTIDAVGKILADMLGTWKISEQCLARIYEQCGGNPLYAEELCKLIVQQNLFDPKKQDLKEDITQLKIPETVRSLIAYRLMKLEEETLKVLKTGAIIGRVFDYYLLEGLSDVKGEALLEALEELISEDFLKEEPGTEEKYKFTQNLMYEIVYSEISTPRKRVLHKRAAEILETTCGHSPKFSPEIGRHYMEAGIYEKAAQYYCASAEYAFKHYALEECIGYAKNAEVCLKKTDRVSKGLLFNLYVTIGKALTLISRFDDAIAAYIQSIEFAENKNEEAEVKLLLCEPYLGKGDVDKAMEIAKEAHEIVESIGDKKLIVKSLLSVGWIYERMGSYIEAIQNYEKASVLTQEVGDERLFAEVYHRYGTVLIFKSDLDRAKEYLEKALKIREKYGEKELIAGTYNNLAIAVDYMGEIDMALDYYIHAKKIYEEIGDVRGVGTLYNNIGGIYLIKGETEKAMDFYEKYLQTAIRIGDLEGMCIAYSNIAWIYNDEMDYDRALECAEKTREIAEKTKNKDMLVLALCYIAEALAAKGELDKAMDTVKRASEIGMLTGSGELAGRVESTYGKIYKFAGDFERAREYFDRAIEIFTTQEMIHESNSNKIELGEAYLAIGKISEAIEVLNAAKKYCEKIAAKKMLEKIILLLNKAKHKSEYTG